VNTHQGFDWITTSEAWQLLGLAVILSHLLHAFVWAELRRGDRWRVNEAERRRNEALNALAGRRLEAMATGLRHRSRPADLNYWPEPPPPRRIELPHPSWPGHGGRLPITYGADLLDLDELPAWPDPPATADEDVVITAEDVAGLLDDISAATVALEQANCAGHVLDLRHAEHLDEDRRAGKCVWCGLEIVTEFDVTVVPVGEG
jgi:hypothetical protein